MRYSANQAAQGPVGYRWLVFQAYELPVSPAVLNLGLAGVLALVAALAWHALGRLLPQ